MHKKIIFIHSLNNWTGSPNVLSLIIREFVSRDYQIDLITSKSEGFLSGIEHISYRYTQYKWCKSKWLTLFLLLYSQIELFLMILVRYRKEKGLFYINTVVPFGAAWACWLLNKKRVYHVHENMRLSKPMYPVYRFTYQFCQQKSIFVSNYLQQVTGLQNDSIVVYNSLSTDFLNRLKDRNNPGNQGAKDILMVCSLRIFKGIYEFIELSKRLPQFSFKLVLSASINEVENFINETNPPSNLTLFSQQTDLHPFYRQARLLLQLSHPDKCIETFGLTILEAMVYGIPAIVPPVGGPTELIDDGINGFTVDPFDLDKMVEKIKAIMEDEFVYSQFSAAGIKKSKQFENDLLINKIENYIHK